MKNITVNIGFKWWVKYYLFGVYVFSKVCGLEANEEKVNAYLRRGIKVWTHD